MYKLSKSVPRGYEYLSSGYSRIRPHKADIVKEYPPAPHFHQCKNYSNVSPLRNKQKLVEARTYRSPLNESQKNSQISFNNKLENIFSNLKVLSSQFKNNYKKIQKQCKENIRKVRTLTKHDLINN